MSNRSCVDKEGEREAAINQSIKRVNRGDLLWVQARSSSWWPGQIVDEATVSASNKPRKRRIGDDLVRLYGSYEYLFVDPIRSSLEFEHTLKKFSGSHSAILKEALKQDLLELRFGKSEKEMKKKGKIGEDISQETMSKQNISDKKWNTKSPSSVKQKIHQVTQEAQPRKKKKVQPEKAKVLSEKLSSESKSTKRKKRKKDLEDKKQGADNSVSVRTSQKRKKVDEECLSNSSSDMSEQGRNKKQKQNGAHKNFSLKAPNFKRDKPKARANHDHSFPEKMGSSKSKGKTKNAGHKKLMLNSVSQTNGDAERKKNSKPVKHELLSIILEETAKEPSARRLKVMRALGLIAPIGSPFIRSRHASSTSLK